MKVAVLASGKGSNVENLLCYFKNNPNIQVVLIGANNNNSGAIEHAKNYNVTNFIFSKKELESTSLLLKTLEKHKVDILVLAGFLLKIPSTFINEFTGKIINVHPSLLPKYGGKGMYGDNVHRAVLSAREKLTGITFHYVNEKYDDGEIIAQFPVVISELESLSSLKEKINKLEKLKFPEIIISIYNESVKKENTRNNI